MTAPARLDRLMGYLASDPDNVALLSDAAHAAFDAGKLEDAGKLIAQIAARGPLNPSLDNLAGLVAMRRQDHDLAVAHFERLMAAGHDAPEVRFNLAWTHALQGNHAPALALLDDPVIAAVPDAAPLKVQMLHHLGALEDALAVGQGLAELYPENRGLMGALSVVAMDAEDIALAQYYATRGGATTDAQTTMGLLALAGQKVEEALPLFQAALSQRADAPRAWLGMGLSLLTRGQHAEAAACVDRGAEQFGTHIGSWIASGWIHFVNSDHPAARARFETAMALDENFAESHGALAVMAIVDGDIDGARRGAEVAMRLDRSCFSAALAKSWLAEIDGNPALASKIRERVMDFPAGPQGQSIRDAIVALGLSGIAGGGSGGAA